MGYLLYGKRSKPWRDSKGRMHEPDSRFAALDAYGCRVTKKNLAFEFATVEDAQDYLDKMTKSKDRNPPDGVLFEIRKAT